MRLLARFVNVGRLFAMDTPTEGRRSVACGMGSVIRASVIIHKAWSVLTKRRAVQGPGIVVQTLVESQSLFVQFQMVDATIDKRSRVTSNVSPEVRT
ncbi:hypothetical protein LguiB_010851 [Lonicera macranthoides]